jgi:hypothetical protein
MAIPKGVFSPEVGALLQGTPFGEIFPPKQNPDFLAIDGRTAAMRVLRKYISFLQFFRAGDKGQPPIPFQIPIDDIHIEWPDNEVDMRFPSIVFLSQGRANYDAIGLGTNLLEQTADRFGAGTVLQVQSEYTENFAIEIWASKKPERRAILAGLEVALTPTEQMYGIRFTVPEYYDQVCRFTLMDREIFDEPDGALNRRRARLYLEMTINMVALVNYRRIEPMMKTEVDVDEDTGVPVDVDQLEARIDVQTDKVIDHVCPPACGRIDNPNRPFPSPTEPMGPADPFIPC